jgi:pyruvate/2-oxoglutarate dehydrogenase complex dihydrolipoamide dehydrogenase (E3) component
MFNRSDMVVIGSGPAGESAANLAAYVGYRVMIIERNKLTKKDGDLRMGESR